jgi:hypothetical protein
MMTTRTTDRSGPAGRLNRRVARGGLALAALCVAVAASGCASTGHPRPIPARELAEAQTFPYYKVYWAGPAFAGQPLAAADGQSGYISTVGDSVYYGDCVHGKGIFGGGSCLLPLQVTTVIYRLHSNTTLGPQRNIVVRARSRSTAGAWRSTSSPTRSPTRGQPRRSCCP